MCARSEWPRDMFVWEYVNMVVTSRCFAFRTLITQARIWQSFLVENSTSLLYVLIPSLPETWEIFANKLSQFFCALKFKIKIKSIFCNLFRNLVTSVKILATKKITWNCSKLCYVNSKFYMWVQLLTLLLL